MCVPPADQGPGHPNRVLTYIPAEYKVDEYCRLLNRDRGRHRAYLRFRRHHASAPYGIQGVIVFNSEPPSVRADMHWPIARMRR